MIKVKKWPKNRETGLKINKNFKGRKYKKEFNTE
jgi:hypothetical protein